LVHILRLHQHTGYDSDRRQDTLATSEDRLSLGADHGKVYTGVVAMLVESAVIYSVFGVIFIGTYFKQDPFNNIVLPILGTLEGICPLLIIYRVAIGRGWTNETVQQMTSTIRSIQFNTPGQNSAMTRRTGNSTMGNTSMTQSIGASDVEMSRFAKVPADLDIMITTEHSTMKGV